MNRGRSTSSAASSVSAPPSSRGDGHDRSASRGSDVALIGGVVDRRWGGGGVVHTGFTSSSDGGSSTAASSRSQSSAAFPHGRYGALHQPQDVPRYQIAPTAAAIVHTGFTTSEDSGSVTSRSRASSPSLSRAPSSNAQLFAGALARRTSQHGLLSATEPQQPLAAPPAAVPSSSWAQEGALRFASAAIAARPLEQPCKADTTPRRKVSPVAPLGTHHAHQPSRAGASSLMAISSPPRNELRGGAHNAPAPLQDGSVNHQPQPAASWESALPPSTLLDLRMRLDILSNAKLVAREEELIKELLRTQQELARRGVPSSAQQQQQRKGSSPAVDAAGPHVADERRPQNSTTYQRWSANDIHGSASSNGDDDNNHGAFAGHAIDDGDDWRSDSNEDWGDHNLRRPSQGTATPAHQRRTPTYHYHKSNRTQLVDTPVSPTANRLRQYAHNLLDMTHHHRAGDSATTAARDLSPLLKSPPSSRSAYMDQQRAPRDDRAQLDDLRFQAAMLDERLVARTSDRGARSSRVPASSSRQDHNPYHGRRDEYGQDDGAPSPFSERDSATRRASHPLGGTSQRRGPPPSQRRVDPTRVEPFPHDHEGPKRDDGGGVWNELAVLRRIRTG